MLKWLVNITGKKNCTILMIVLFAALGIAATNHADEKFLNLQVLPKDISSARLDKIMDEDFQQGLGINCEYCHRKDKATGKFDYASDAVPEKETARDMMRLTLEINKKYFNQQHPAIGDTTLTVNCYTCHRGNAIPKK